MSNKVTQQVCAWKIEGSPRDPTALDYTREEETEISDSNLFGLSAVVTLREGGKGLRNAPPNDRTALRGRDTALWENTAQHVRRNVVSSMEHRAAHQLCCGRQHPRHDKRRKNANVHSWISPVAGNGQWF